MRLARRQVELAAASRSSVLLVGPPGADANTWPPPSITGRGFPRPDTFVVPLQAGRTG